ncbi:hypothetical protein GCM10017764_21140 [Sphingobacterium griseoflavum]|uniref:Uncharacterized protein n=1 Tax=Sphingobacterium griseoflavum TaxID=1474952 RepID=A0ABQ3HV45_9SPHI|nr:hypothetical protein GCM10017764_21140 [Sphingobacterium griseoflavum]
MLKNIHYDNAKYTMKNKLHILIFFILVALASILISFGLIKLLGSEYKDKFYTSVTVGAIIGAVTVFYINLRSAKIEK